MRPTSGWSDAKSAKGRVAAYVCLEHQINRLLRIGLGASHLARASGQGSRHRSTPPAPPISGRQRHRPLPRRLQRDPAGRPGLKVTRARAARIKAASVKPHRDFGVVWGEGWAISISPPLFDRDGDENFAVQPIIWIVLVRALISELIGAPKIRLGLIIDDGRWRRLSSAWLDAAELSVCRQGFVFFCRGRSSVCRWSANFHHDVLRHAGSVKPDVFCNLCLDAGLDRSRKRCGKCLG